MGNFDLDMTEELEHRDWVRQQRMSAASRATLPPLRATETAVQQLDRERAELGPNLMLAMHRRARKLGLLPAPEPSWGLRIAIAWVVAIVALLVVPGVGNG